MQITEELIAQYDISNMRDAIRSMPDHLRDAVKRAVSGLSNIAPRTYRNIVLGGVGGSAIGGDLVRSYLGADLMIPFEIVRGYDLPKYADSDTLVIISSYSGNTEESLSIFDQAIERGIEPVCIAAGGRLLDEAMSRGLTLVQLPLGYQPRAALAYSFVSVLLALQYAGLAPKQQELLAACAESLQELNVELGNVSGNAATELARQLIDSIPVIYSASEILGTVNLRWRGQIQENAKHLAFGNVLPEMNHNEILGWEYPTDVIGRFKVIFMRSSSDEHSRVQKRFEVLKHVLNDGGVQVIEINAEGDTRLARMFYLISLGDWVSYYLAIMTNTDPTPIPAIDRLKAALS